MAYIYKAGVVGAGQMGAGIAQVITYSGLPVVLKDVNEDMVKKGLQTIRGLYEARVKKGKMSPEQLEQKMALVQGSTSYDDFADVDLVIEAIFEDLDLKKKVFADLGKSCPPSAILTSNTSALSITAMGEASGRPDRVAGLHFFYPAPVMKLVEVIPTKATSQDTLDTCVSFIESLRKIPVRVKECAGFLVNRLLMPYVGEAVYALQDGAATATEIDEKMTEFGMPMGPFFLADQLGIDICWKVAHILHAAYGDRAKPPEALRVLFEKKRYGAKTGAGFYSYSDQPEIWNELVLSKKKTPFSVERIVYPMINEAVTCLEEGIAAPSDIDMAMIAGTGFPQDKGGLLKYADTLGLDEVLAKLRQFEKEIGPRFHPAPLLERKVKAGELGAKAKKGFFDYT
jgi:3-hydroxyacyl-CoA dehydrogenase